MDFSLIKDNLISLGYKVSTFATKEEATEYLNAQIDGVTVGFGGSQTIMQMGVLQMLDTHNKVLWRFDNPDGKTPEQIMKEALIADVFLTSANGVAQSGEIVNIDGTCNRVAATFYGHKKVYIIVGSNKIANNFDAALWRARNVAAPLNAKRLNRNTPCAIKGDKCYNCSSPERICRGLSVFWCAPRGCEYEVVLIDETLGF